MAEPPLADVDLCIACSSSRGADQDFPALHNLLGQPNLLPTAPHCSPGEVRATVGRSNDGPEAVYDAQKDQQNKGVAGPLGAAASVSLVSLGGGLGRVV
jgi:hypothetical protein